MALLRTGEELPHKYYDHQLTGNYRDLRELHVDGKKHSMVVVVCC
jgi:addiction module RelE/StbE family toxin